MARDDLPIFNLPKHRKVLNGYLDGITGLCRIDVQRLRDQRTLAQNAYLHGVVFVYVAKGLSDAWGRRVTMDEAKHVCKDRFLRRPVCNPDTGEVIEGYYYTPSTADLNKAECAEFIDNILAWSADELNTRVPAPDEFEQEVA